MMGGRMSEPDLLRDLADRVRRLSPSHRDPERFHIEKDEVARQLMTLARRREMHR